MKIFQFVVILYLRKQFFPIFAPAISGKIGVARESTFFALFLSSKLGHFTKSRNIGLIVAFAVMWSIYLHSHTAEQDPIHILLLRESKPYCWK